MSNIRIVKRKARGFFKPEDTSTIKEAVTLVHNIVANASILLRAYYLDWFQNNHPLKDDKEALTFEHYHVSMACNIVQGVIVPPVRGTGQDEKIKTFQQMLETYKNLYNRSAFGNKAIDHDLSLSHILSYSMDNLLTAYVNNIQMHFPKYPKRFIRCDMLSKGSDLQTAKQIAAAYTSTYLYDQPFELEEKIIQRYNLDLDTYKFLFPSKMTEKKLPRCWDLKVHPWVYLPKMVMINQALETDFSNVKPKHRKLLNPLPFHSSFVPMHIRLDTSGLSQLLMSKERIDDFKFLYKAEHGVELNMKTKANMLSSFERLFGRAPSSNREAGQYATELWSFLTNLRNCRQWKELDSVVRKNDPNKVKWVFDNAVVTDGVSISFQVIDDSLFGRKVLTGRKKSKNPQTEDDVEPKIQKLHGDQEKKKLGADPGKHDLVAITDGFMTIRYTKGQRDTDTYKRKRTKETLRKKRKNGLEEYETQVMNRFQKNSCHPETFKRYVTCRKQIETTASKCYSHPMLREFKFLVHTKVKSSEHRFMDRVFKTFKDPNNKLEGRCGSEAMRINASKQVTRYQDIVIGWGNWGKTPNALKCGIGPTPGIGLRRSFETLYQTKTIDEHLTSQTCPCCKGVKCLKKTTIGQHSIEKHHLLRCTNDSCLSRWWNRNVVGAFNILSRFLEATLPGNETTGSGSRRKRQPPKPRT